MKQMTLDEYKAMVEYNLIALPRALESGQYPQLTMLFNAYGGSLQRKLVCLYKYFIAYGENKAQRVSYHESRGIEMMASLQTLVNKYKSDKRTWNKSISKLCALQIIGVRKPDNDPECKFNTQEQQYSYERAEARINQMVKAASDYGMSQGKIESLKKKHVNACYWYRAVKLTDDMLAMAEALAPSIKAMGAGIDKDAIRDVRGEDLANSITDTGWDMHSDTEDRRTCLKAELERQLSNRGYATVDDVICRSAAGHCYVYDRWVKTWKSYKPRLMEELGLRYSRPSKAEMEKFKLQTCAFIIRSDTRGGE